MNKYLFFVVMFVSTSSYAAPGCLDNSYHLKQKNDPGTWHPVACSCPCGSPGYHILANGMCINCRHRHDPQPLTTVTYDGQQKEKEIYPSMKTIAQKLLAKVSH